MTIRLRYSTRGGRLLNRQVPLWGWAFVGVTFREEVEYVITLQEVEHIRVIGSLPKVPDAAAAPDATLRNQGAADGRIG